MVTKEKKDVGKQFVDLSGNSRYYARMVQFGFITGVCGLLFKYILLVYGFDDLKGWVGTMFGGIADFGGIVGIVGFALFILGLISVALLGKKVHLYLRIGILIAVAIFMRGFISLSSFL